jgi:hypothetical protein
MVNVGGMDAIPSVRLTLITAEERERDALWIRHNVV